MEVFNLIKKFPLLKNTGIYTCANVLSSMVPFFCMPVLTRYLTPADYGIVAMMGAIISFLTPFIGINIQGAIAAHYYSARESFVDFVKACNSILLLSSVIVLVIIYFFSEYIAEYTLFPGDWLWAVVMMCISQFVYGIYLTMLQMKQLAVSYGITQVLNVCMNVGLSIFLIVIFNMSWQGRVIAQCFTMGLFMFVSITYLYKSGLLGININKVYIEEALKFGVPLIPHAISGSLITVLDRFYIANFVDLSSAGLFVLGAQIGSGMDLLTASFNKAYVPWFYDKLSKIDMTMKYTLVRYTYVYFVVVLLLAAIYSYMIPMILNYFVGERFIGASVYVWAFAFSGALNGMYYMVVNYFFYEGKTVYLMLITFISSLLHTALSYWLTKQYGALGASYCVVLTHFIIFILVWYFSNKVYKMPWFSFYS